MLFSKSAFFLVWWPVPITLALGELRRKDAKDAEFQVTLSL